MAQLERNFLKAKMNKDLDERLVPNGEYRDALNVQIATSDGSDVGAVQTIPSNAIWIDGNFSSSAQTVGVFNDSENNHIYNFVCDSNNFVQQTVFGNKVLTGKRSDTIYRIEPDKNSAKYSTSKVIIHDIYEVRIVPNSDFDNNDLQHIIINKQPDSFSLPINSLYNNYSKFADIRPGMRVQAINLAGEDVYGPDNKVIVKQVSATADNKIRITTTGLNGGSFTSLYTSSMYDQSVYLKFTAPRVLKFRKGNSYELELNNASPFDSAGEYVEPKYYPEIIDSARSKIPQSTGNITYTPYNSYISAINLIGDFLMWTDSRNEPKKINIKRCIKGNDNIHNSLVNVAKAHHTMLVVESNKNMFSAGYLKESHITTLKPNPCNALEADAINSSASSYSQVPIFSKVPGTDQPFAAWSLHDNSNTFLTADDTIWIKPAVEGVSFNEGAILTITGSQSSSQAQIQIDTYNSSGQYYIANLISGIPENYTVEAPDEIWNAFVTNNDGLYTQDFVSFSYRYIYTDGEVSCLAPFTQPVFAAGDYAYSSKNGYNLGMQNNMEEIKIHSFENRNTPLDVAALEFVFKSQKSDNIYSFKTLDRQPYAIQNFQLNQINLSQYSPKFLPIGLFPKEISVKEKLFGYTLPSDQLTRIFDAVPKKAVAQEVQANRLMYANYTQDYDLLDSNNSYVIPNIATSVKSVSAAGFNSSYFSSNVLNASAGSYNVVNTNAETSETNPFVTQTDPGDYALSAVGPQNLRTSTAIQMNVEYDPGNNWSGTMYTAPATGTYTISGSVSFSGQYSETIFEGSSSNVITLPRRVRLAIYYTDNENNELATGQPLYATPYNDSVSANLGEYNYDANEVRTIDFYTIIDLSEGEEISLFAQSDQFDGNFANGITIEQSTFNVDSAPSTQFDLPTLRGQKSIKSERNYNIGIVYRDELGRESSVLIGEDEDFNCQKEQAPYSNYLSFNIKNNPPAWAKTYKLFIKENTSKYSNLVLEAAFLSDVEEGDYIYLVFNSVDINKVKIGDYLVAKKQQGVNTPVVDVDAKFRIISIIGDAEFNDDDTLFVGNTQVPESIIATADQLDGKFFVKIFKEGIIGPNTTLGVIGDGLVSGGNNNGAVFEVEPENTVDIDLYYEISDALPISLDTYHADKYIRPKSYVSITNENGNNFGVFSNNELYTSNPKVTNVAGAITNGPLQLQNNNDDAYCKVTLDTVSDVFVDTSYQDTGVVDTIVTFKISEREFYQAYLARPIQAGDFVIYVLPLVHGGDLSVAPGFYNCFSFGNGVESDTIRDDFNAAELLKYTATGKQSGVKANVPIKNYEEYTRPSDIIFSEIYNESAGSNRFNEFIVAKEIIKQINPDYGSIQKLFSRDNDLLTLCEKKCLRVLSKKDALFNADGNPQLLATNKVLGQAIPFTGDYGISKNPESFASDEYRCYFTDVNRGAVLRLSKDGLTPISKAGMDDWFSDHLVNTRAAIGSFDGDKEEYNITLHEIVQPGVSKLVYTVSFSEEVNGWTSFKSYIQDAGLTINNKYYTFKNGFPWRHDVPEEHIKLLSATYSPLTMYYNLANPYDGPSADALTFLADSSNVSISNVSFNLLPPTYNNFYGVQYLSEITTLFNDQSDVVKTFRYFNYEGSQARITQNTTDEEYYNLIEKSGWYCEFINTDIQEAGKAYFKEKENKWFGYVKGVQTKHKNVVDGGTILDTNIDTKEHTIQGLGEMTSNVTLIDGTLPSSGYNVYISTNFDYDSQLEEDEDSSSSIYGLGGGGSADGGGGGGY